MLGMLGIPVKFLECFGLIKRDVPWMLPICCPELRTQTVRRPNSDACRSPVSGEDAPEVLEAPDLWALAGAPALPNGFLLMGRVTRTS